MNTAILKKGVDLAIAKAPELLSATAVVGVGATGFLSARAGVKSQEAIADAEVAKMEALGLKEIPDLDAKEKFLATWKVWAPPVAAGVTTIGCIIGSNRVAMGRLAAVTAYGLLIEQSYDDIKAAIIEKLGPEAYDEVKNGIAQQRVDRFEESGPNPAYVGDDITTSWDENQIEGGNVLFFDPITQRFFWSDMGHMLDVKERVNTWLNAGEFVSMNDVYCEIPLKPSKIFGDKWGFSLLTTGYMDYDFGLAVGPNHIPCHVLNWEPNDRYHQYYGG